MAIALIDINYKLQFSGLSLKADNKKICSRGGLAIGPSGNFTGGPFTCMLHFISILRPSELAWYHFS